MITRYYFEGPVTVREEQNRPDYITKPTPPYAVVGSSPVGDRDDDTYARLYTDYTQRVVPAPIEEGLPYYAGTAMLADHVQLPSSEIGSQDWSTLVGIRIGMTVSYVGDVGDVGGNLGFWAGAAMDPFAESPATFAVPFSTAASTSTEFFIDFADAYPLDQYGELIKSLVIDRYVSVVPYSTNTPANVTFYELWLETEGEDAALPVIDGYLKSTGRNFVRASL